MKTSGGFHTLRQNDKNQIGRMTIQSSTVEQCISLLSIYFSDGTKDSMKYNEFLVMAYVFNSSAKIKMLDVLMLLFQTCLTFIFI